MRLTFLGATHEVTGSCYYLEAAGKKFLVDCGMEQGPNIYENKPIPVPASQLDFVLITHAHIDHTGNLPLLYAHGFRGPIYMTPATVALSDIMLRDSAHIQLAEAEWRNRTGTGQPAGRKSHTCIGSEKREQQDIQFLSESERKFRTTAILSGEPGHTSQYNPACRTNGRHAKPAAGTEESQQTSRITGS